MPTTEETNPIKSDRTAMKVLCQRIVDKGRQLTIDSNGEKKVINVDGEWKEVFPGVDMKAIFPDEPNSKFAIKARADACINIHEVLPNKLVYVAYGEHEDLHTGTIYREDDAYKIKSKDPHGMKFTTDSKLIIETTCE